jgi:hypothetical protein
LGWGDRRVGIPDSFNEASQDRAIVTVQWQVLGHFDAERVVALTGYRHRLHFSDERVYQAFG